MSSPIIVSSTIKAELALLKSQHCLLEQDAFAVFQAPATVMPKILLEIGRLREITFRAIGEGSGLEIDLDNFDQHYHHLFVWDHQQHCIAGALRLGLIKNINECTNLYVLTHYHFENPFFEKLIPCIELGRLFITQPYQNSDIALSLLWRGLGRFIGKHPQYRAFYGLCSISNQYTLTTQQLIVTFLKQSLFDNELAPFVKPNNPFKIPEATQQQLLKKLDSVKTLLALQNLIHQLDPTSLNIPPLFALYDSFATKYCGFSIDEQFSHVIDCLGVSFIKRIPQRKLHYFMGKAGLDNYNQYHQLI